MKLSSYIKKKHPSVVCTRKMPISNEFTTTQRIISQQTSTLFIDAILLAETCIGDARRMSMNTLVEAAALYIDAAVHQRPNISNIYLAIENAPLVEPLGRGPRKPNRAYADVFVDRDEDFALGKCIHSARDDPLGAMRDEGLRPIMYSYFFGRLLSRLKTRLVKTLDGRVHPLGVHVLYPIFKKFRFDESINDSNLLENLHYNSLRFQGEKITESMHADCFYVGALHALLGMVLSFIRNDSASTHALEVHANDDDCMHVLALEYARNAGLQATFWCCADWIDDGDRNASNHVDTIISVGGFTQTLAEGKDKELQATVIVDFVTSFMLLMGSFGLPNSMPLLCDESEFLDMIITPKGLASVKKESTGESFVILHSERIAYFIRLVLLNCAFKVFYLESEGIPEKWDESMEKAEEAKDTSLRMLHYYYFTECGIGEKDVELAAISENADSHGTLPELKNIHPINVARRIRMLAWSLSHCMWTGSGKEESDALARMGVSTNLEIVYGEAALQFLEEGNKVESRDIQIKLEKRSIVERSLDPMIRECPVFWGAMVFVPHSDTGARNAELHPEKYTDEMKKMFESVSRIPHRAAVFCADKISLLNIMRPSWFGVFMKELMDRSDYPRKSPDEALILLLVHAQTIMSSGQNDLKITDAGMKYTTESESRHYLVHQLNEPNDRAPFERLENGFLGARISRLVWPEFSLFEREVINKVARRIPMTETNNNLRTKVISLVSEVCDYAYPRLGKDAGGWWIEMKEYPGIWSRFMENAWLAALRYKIAQGLDERDDATKHMYTQIGLYIMRKRRTFQTWVFAYYDYKYPMGLPSIKEEFLFSMLHSNGAFQVVENLTRNIPLLDNMEVCISRSGINVYFIEWHPEDIEQYILHVVKNVYNKPTEVLERVRKRDPVSSLVSSMIITLETKDAPIFFMRATKDQK